MRPTPAYWDGVADRWIVTSQFPLTDGQLARIAMWLLGVQRKRRLQFGPGDVRDDLDRAIAALEATPPRIACGLADQGSGVEPFRATRGTGKIISLGRAA